MAVETIERHSPSETDTSEPNRLSHIANKHDITRAYIEGTPIVALCGKRWVPSRDPSKFPKCQRCVEIFREMFGEEL